MRLNNECERCMFAHNRVITRTACLHVDPHTHTYIYTQQQYRLIQIALRNSRKDDDDDDENIFINMA